MKHLYYILAVVLLLAIARLWVGGNTHDQNARGHIDPVAKLKQEGKIVSDKQRPHDWFYIQRAYPYNSIPPDKPMQAIEAAREMREMSPSRERQYRPWQEIGPTNVPGRITDLAIHDTDTNTIYAGSAAGGVFKSTDHGQSWTAIFDDVGVQSVGAIAIDPDNPNILYVGTGEANAAADNYEGTGIYKTLDGGQTWSWVGLPYSYHIGKIVIDPYYPQTVFVAVGGRHFGGTNPERGLYRSINGGDTWDQILYDTDSTCCIDVALHPSTGTVFAAMWEKWRYKGERIGFSGITSKLWKSTDYGDSWTQVSGTGGFPAPASNISRIGVTVDPYSETVYASIIDDNTNELYGIYKSINLGDTWTQLDDTGLSGMFGGFGWYFGQIRVAPGNPDLVYILGVRLFMSYNGGTTWVRDDDGIHVDHHAMCLLPRTSPSGTYQVYNGCDGGVNYKWNDALPDWENMANMPNTQFYAITIDENISCIYFGGTQDNGTLRHSCSYPGGWDHVLGGDGFYCVVDYTNSDVVYAESQFGYLRKSLDGGDDFSIDALGDMDYYADRHNWCTPFVIDPVDHNTLYYGSNRLWKTTNGCVNWYPISGDLSDGPYPTYPSFGTITTIAVAPTNTDVIYVGTDDGNVQVTETGDFGWNLRTSGLPDRYVTRVAVDPNDASRAFVTLSGYNWSDPMPHIFETDDYGVSWYDISGNLPDAPINDVIPNPNDPSVLWIATDFGVYVTYDDGYSWEPFGQDMPIVPVHDLAYNDGDQILVAGTHGRSMYRVIVNDYAYFVASPNAFCYPFHVLPDGHVDTTFTVTNIGNAGVPYTVEIEYTDGAPGWLDVYPGAGWIDAGASNWVDFDMAVDGLGYESYLHANIIINYDDPQTGELIIGVDLYSFYDFHSPEDQRIRTAANRLNVSQVRIAHDDEGSMASYFDPPNDPIDMLFDGSLVISTGSDNNNYMVFFSDNYNPALAPDNGLFYALSTTDIDSTTYINPDLTGYRYATGEATTHDSTIAYTVEYFAPGHPDSADFYIMHFEVYAGPNFSTTLYDVNIGYIADFDIPYDGEGFTNESGFDDIRNLIFQQGQPDGSPQGYDTRFGGLAYFGDYDDGLGKFNPGGVTVDNESWIWPNSNFVQADLFDILDQQSGWDLSPYSGERDLTSILVIAQDETIDASNRLDFIVILALSNDGMTKSLADLQNSVDKAINFAYSHIVQGQSYICGDANASQTVNVADVVFLIDYIFRGGPAPEPVAAGDVDECGSINVSDVIYLCDYIFAGGPAPCGGSVTCYLPTGNNHVDLGCPVDVPVLDIDSVGIPIYLTNDATLDGFSLGFHYNSDDLEVTSIDLTGSIVPYPDYFWHSLLPEENLVLIGYTHIISTYSIPPQSGGLLATMWIQLPPGTPDQIINIDSIFVDPAGEFIFSPNGGGSLKPDYNDCGAAEIRIGSCVDGIGEGCVYEQSTPEGENVNVELEDVTLTFDDVTTQGSSEMTITTTGPAGNSSFEIIPSSEPLYYNITTSAGFSDNIEVCIVYDDAGLSLEDEEALTIQHYNGSTWNNVTTSLNTGTNTICGEVSSLSPFVIAISTYICGDADASGIVEISDAVYLINYVFVPGSPAPDPIESGDADCSGVVEISDAVYIINYVFTPGSPAPCDPDGDGEPDC